MPDEQIDQHTCRMHGNLLRTAYDNNVGHLVGVYEAVRSPKHEYLCPRCSLQVYPEADTPILPMNVMRHAHFNAPKGFGKAPRTSHTGSRHYEDITQLVKEVIALKLRESGDFSYVGTDLAYTSARRQHDGHFYTHQKFDVDVFCRRESPESIDVILHVIELPMANMKLNDLYNRVADIATEYSGDKAKVLRSPDNQITLEDVVTIGNRQVHRRVHQNFVVVMNDASLKIGRTRAELPPTVHNFVAYLTNNKVFYFDPDKLETSLFTISDPRKVTEERETNEHNPNISYRFKREDMPYFSLIGQEPIKKVRRFANVEPDDQYRKKFSINMSRFRVALPTKVELGTDGKPFSAERKGSQTELILS